MQAAVAAHPYTTSGANIRRPPGGTVTMPARHLLRCLLASALLPGTALAQVGFPNVNRPEPPGTLLTATPRMVDVCNAGTGQCALGAQQSVQIPDGFTADGRGAMIAYHADLLWTIPEHPSSAPNSTLHIKAWDIRDPANPLLVQNFGFAQTSPQPMNAHGYNFHEGQLELGGPILGLIARTGFQQFSTAPFFELNSLHNLVCCRERVIPGWVMGRFLPDDEGNPGGPGEAASIWFYNLDNRQMAIGRRATLNSFAARDIWARFDHLGQTGVFGLPMPFGDLLIVASEEATTSGVAIYDLKPTYRNQGTPPTLLGVFKDGVVGGYWPELWGEGDRLYVVFPRRLDRNGWMVLDISDPTAISVVADVDLPNPNDGPMYVQFQDNFAFIDRFKVDMNNPGEAVLEFPAYQDNQKIRDLSQFVLPLGNLMVSGGSGSTLRDQALRIWVHQQAADTRGPSVGYHRPRPNQTDWPEVAPLSFLIHETLDATSITAGSVLLRPVVGGVPGAPVATTMNFTSGGQLNVVPNAPLPDNTEFQVDFVAGGIRDVADNGIMPYSFRFSTGGAASGNAAPVISAYSATPYPAGVGQALSFSASASDADDDSLEYRFVFGDGSDTGWQAASTAQHAYAAIGRYRAQVQVRDGNGGQSSRATSASVLPAPPGALPVASSTIAVDAANDRAFVVNPDADSLARIDLATRQRNAEFSTCADPRAAARDGAGRIWVSCFDGDRVQAFDPASGTLLADLATGYGSAPFAIVIGADGDTAYVSLSGSGELLRISDLDGARSQTRLPLGPSVRALALSADGTRLLATRFVSPSGRGEVWDVDTSSFTLTRTFFLRLRTQADSSADGIGVPNYLASVAIAPDGQSAWVVGKRDNTPRGRQFFDGRHELDPDNSVRVSLHVLNLATGDASQLVDAARFRDIDNSDSPSAVLFSPRGDYAFVALQGNNQVVVFDALQMAVDASARGLVGRIAVQNAPQGLALHDGELLVQNFLSRSLSVVPLATLEGNGVLPAPAAHIDSNAVEALTPSMLQGKRIFYNAADPRMNSEGYISCATCHVDGSSDGRVWDFSGRGEGLRNTIDLRGRAGMGHGLVHWSANFDEIQDFENDIRLAFGGRGFLSDSDFAAAQAPLGASKAGRSAPLDALAAYVSSLGNDTIPRSPHRAADGSLGAAAQRGNAVFSALGCGSCHDPAANYRSDGLRDVGSLRATSGQRLGATLAGIETPTLLGLWDNAPYLHDGSAATLAEVFATSAGVRRQAEAAQLSAGVEVTTAFIDLNDGNSSHGGFIAFGAQGAATPQNPGQTVTFSNLDGGSGGSGRLELRAAGGRNGFNAQFEVSLNGAVVGSITVPGLPTPYDWRRFALEGLPLAAGSANTLVLRLVSATSFPFVLLDEISVARPADLAAAAAHRVVRTRPAGDQADLIAYLLALDGSDAASGDGPRVFADGFEDP
jgi:cytochrome c551/c552/WD40 repeat protein